MSARIAMRMHLHSDGSARWLGLPALVLCAATALGCADARGRFQDFQTRLNNVDAGSAGGGDLGDESYDGGPCVPPAPGTVNGPALLAIDTNLAAGKPILFLGNIDTPARDGTTAVHFVYRALDSLDRSTRLGAELEVGPFPVHGGALSAPVPESTLDGDANPIIHGVPITSSMTLTGHICGLKQFYCGTLEGQTSGTLSGPFNGHFGITLLSGPDAVPPTPRFGCGGNDFAEPLPH